jgi:hypothetical protein
LNLHDIAIILFIVDIFRMFQPHSFIIYCFFAHLSIYFLLFQSVPVRSYLNAFLKKWYTRCTSKKKLHIGILSLYCPFNLISSDLPPVYHLNDLCYFILTPDIFNFWPQKSRWYKVQKNIHIYIEREKDKK